jgi:hypothetical protein
MAISRSVMKSSPPTLDSDYNLLIEVINDSDTPMQTHNLYDNILNTEQHVDARSSIDVYNESL